MVTLKCLAHGTARLRYDGFPGLESVRADGVGITVSYWRDEASILEWKRDTEHVKAERGGRETKSECYEARIAKVERAYRAPGKQVFASAQ